MSVKQMMGVLRELEQTPSTLHKEELLKAAGEGIPHFKDMLRYALDPYKKYGIQKIVGFRTDGKAVPAWSVLGDILEAASQRVFTGQDLISVIHNRMSDMGPSGRELFKRVLLKDLRCGVGAVLVNKVFPHLIPEFGVMLANPLLPHHFKIMTKAKAAWYQAKKNGDRLIAMIPPGKAEPRAFSRKGHELFNYGLVLKNLKFVLDQSEWKDVGLVFDGEIIMTDFWKTRGVKKLAGNEAEGAQYHIFDIVSMPMWEEQTSLKYSKRRIMLSQFCNVSAFGLFENLVRVSAFPVDLTKLSLDYFDDLRDRMVKKGEEGLMIRPDLPYNYKSRMSLMKHKKMDTMDCTIIEILPGDEGKKHENRAGRVMVCLDDGETLCKAGLKATDAVRADLWARRNELAGMTCEVAYQSKTESKSGVAKLQFPVFIRVREDKS